MAVLTLLIGSAQASAPAGTAKEAPGVYAGLPQGQRFSARGWARVLRNEGFTVGYSELRRNPLWVAYEARPVRRRRAYARLEDFATDERTVARVTTRDFSRSGYQRGHLAPSWLIAQLHGVAAQRQTFLMSNVAPQRANLNQKVWQRLEEVEADRFARWFDGVWVIAGPVFDGHAQHLRSGVEIPDAFFRIFADEDGAAGPRLLAFIVPQNVRGDEPLDQFLVTVDEIERQTELDFFPGLEDTVEARAESAAADREYWRLGEVSRLPPRY